MRQPNILHSLVTTGVFLGMMSVVCAAGSAGTPVARGWIAAVLSPTVYHAPLLLTALALVVLLSWNFRLRRRLKRAAAASSLQTKSSDGLPLAEIEERLAVVIHTAELGSSTVRELCQRCVDGLREVLHLGALVIYDYDADHGRLTVAAASGLGGDLEEMVDPERASESTMAVLRQAVNTASSDHITGVGAGTRAPDLARAAGTAGFTTVDVFPLVSKECVEGVVLAFASPDAEVRLSRTHGYDMLEHELAHAMRVKDVEYRFRLERQRLNDVLRAMGDGVMLIDRDLRIIWCTHGDAKSPEHGAAEKDEPCHRHRYDSDEPCPECPAVRAFSSGQMEIGEVHVSPSAGEPRCYQVTGAPLKKDGDKVCQVLVVSHDVTEQQQLRHQLIWADKLSSVGELVAGVAHELNNPLAAVLGFSELMLAGEVPGNVREDLERIHKEAVRCRKVVQNLLSFARHTPFEKKPVSINELVDTTLELKSYQLRVDNITVRREFSGDLPATTADGQQLQQVFINLINNAHDAIRGKGAPGTLTVRTFPRDDRIVIEVADTGPGITTGNLRRIFDPFFTTKQPGEGTGLGLSLAYGIVKEHGGDIHVESTPGAGATFTVELPVEQGVQATDSDEGKVRDERVEHRRLDVLVVDDEPAMVELISGLLGLAGHRVTTTADGREALKLIERHVDRFDLIITDVKMPGVSGEQICRRVCELRPDSAPSIIFTTGDTANTETRRLLELTGNTVLEKPFRIEDLRQVIERTMADVR